MISGTPHARAAHHACPGSSGSTASTSSSRPVVAAARTQRKSVAAAASAAASAAAAGVASSRPAAAVSLRSSNSRSRNNSVVVAASSPPAAAAVHRSGSSRSRNSNSSSSSRASVAASASSPSSPSSSSSSSSSDPDDEARFAEDYDALTDAIRVTAERLKEKLSGTPIYLVGMMGSGKSTVGKLVGAALRYQLFDTDQLIEAAASAETGTPTTVAEIFAAEGEEAFREAETATLQALLPYTSVVVATGGGAVTKRANWGLMQHGIVCWLDGPAPLLASRAAKDGIAKRPLLQQQQGEEANTSGENSEDELTARLSSLLEKRKAQYANADLRIPLVSATETSSSASSASPALVTFRLLRALEKRIDGDAAAREEERKFEITGTTDVPKTMRVVPAKGGGNGGGGGGGGGESGKGKGGKGFGRKSKDGGGAPAA